MRRPKTNTHVILLRTVGNQHTNKKCHDPATTPAQNVRFGKKQTWYNTDAWGGGGGGGYRAAAKRDVMITSGEAFDL